MNKIIIQKQRFIYIKIFIAIWIFGCVLVPPIHAQNIKSVDNVSEPADFEDKAMDFEDPFSEEDELDIDTSFSESDGNNNKQINETPGFFETLLQPARFTLKHEHSYKTKEPSQTVNNRSSARLEYSKFFGTYFFLQFDTKLNIFYKSDHRAKAEEKDTFFESNTKEAYLQSSIKNTSLKAGLQVIIWGEADGAAVTDVVAPRDQSELFFISLDESRIAQPMIVIDQFSEMGDWTFFYIPAAEYTKVPEKGTQYDLGLLDNFEIEDDKDLGKNSDEMGLRWKKTFGKSDVAIMAASLIENDYKYEMRVLGTLVKTKNRYKLLGLAFNYGKGAFLFKGEIAQKSKKAFNNAQYELINKDVVDTALSTEYASSGSYSLLLSLINQRIVDWDKRLIGTDADSGAITISWSNNYLNENLSALLMSSFYYPNEAVIYTFKTEYKYYDDLKFEASLLKLDIKNDESQLWFYRDEERLTFKIQYQF